MPINFGPQWDEGVYRIKAVNPSTNCYAWMDSITTIYPNPEVFEVSPQSGGCAPLTISLEDFELEEDNLLPVCFHVNIYQPLMKFIILRG